MRKRWITPTLVALFMVISPLGVAKAQPPFLGENLTFEITFLRIPVVTATFRVTEETAAGGQPIYHLAVSAKSTPFYSLLYRVDNQYHSFFTWPQVHPLRYERRIRETGVDFRRMVSYHDGQALYDGERQVSVPPGVRDLFSALYALRGQALEEDQVIDSPLDLDGQLWEARAVVLGRERVETRLGSHPAIKVLVRFLGPDQPQRHKRESDVLTNNLVREKTKLTIWFSDDEQKIPLRAQYNLAPFPLKAVLSALN